MRIEEHSGLLDVFTNPVETATNLLKRLTTKKVRDPDLPALQNSGDAINVPRRRKLAAEGIDALVNSELVGPGINEISNATIGTGRRLKPNFDSRRLGLTAEQEVEFTDDIKSLWALHMESKRKWIDQEGDQTLAEMERTVLEQTLAAGEMYTLGFWFADANRPFRTALALIDNDRVRDPSNVGVAEQNEIVAGHRKGPSGRTRSYFVHNYHRNDPRNQNFSDQDYVEVRRYNEFGREQVIHTYVKRLPGMTRGLSHLTGSFGKLKCFEKYEQVRLEAAIMQTAMAFVIKSNDKNVLSQIGNTIGVDEEQLKKMYAYSLKKALDSQEYHNESGMNIDGVKGIRLLENEEAEILTGSQSGVNDKQFVDECLTGIARGLGLNRATFIQDFEASYSAARAALISFYRQCENLGNMIVDDWLQSVYTMWLEDVIESGQLVVPNYPNPTEAWMHFVVNRELYCRARFSGPARDEIDQAKTMAFWRERRNLGAFTYAEFYDTRGKEWQEEIRQQFVEMKFLDQMIDSTELKHIDPIAFIQGKLEKTTSAKPEQTEEPEDDTEEDQDDTEEETDE